MSGRGGVDGEEKKQGAAFQHYLIFTLLTIGCLTCMGCSAIYHAMAAHMNQRTHDLFHALDYLGISAIIMASFIPGCYYAFVCQPWLQWGYMAMISVLGSAGIVAPLLPFFEEPSFYWARLGIYASIGASSIVPVIHSVFATPFNQTTIPLYVGIYLSLILDAFGVVVYATKFPERFAPGRFDLYLQSHQIWHTAVLMGGIVHYFTCVGFYQNWSIMQGKC